jgi:hypothetical protein
MIRNGPGRTRRGWGALLATAALVLAGCGGAAEQDAQEDPEAALQEAVEALEDYEGLEMTLALSADETARAGLLADGEMEEQELDLLLSSALTVRATSDEDAGEGSAEVAISLGDRTPIELRVIDERFFVRADLPELFDALDDPELAGDLGELTELLPPDIVTALEDGGWLEIVGIDDLDELFGPGATGDDEPQELDEEQAERIAERISERFSTFVEQDVEASFAGEEDAGDRLLVTTEGAAAAALLQDVVSIVASEAGDLAAGITELDEELSQLETQADEQVELDVWLEDGRISQVAFDLTEATDEPLDGEMLLLIGMQEFTGSIDVPDDVTELDLFRVLTGFFLGGMGDLGAMDDDAWMDEEWDDEAWDDEAWDDEAWEDEASDDVPDGEASDDGGTPGEAPEADGVVDEAFDEDPFEDGQGFDCVTEEELTELREALDPEQVAEIEQLFEDGFLERC